MEVLGYILCFLAGALTVYFSQRGGVKSDAADEPPERDDKLSEDIETISQWGNLLRYDGKIRGEGDK